MKTNEVRPETFLQGLAQYSYDDMIRGLGRLAATPDDLLMGLAGLGRLGQAGTMTAIVANYVETATKQAALDKARKETAKKDPMAAFALKQAVAKTAAPGTNESRGVVQAMALAAKKAQEAKQAEASAKRLVGQNDPRAGAAQAVVALTKAREAMTLANKAEKTRLARGLDVTINTLESQAKFLDGKAQEEQRRSGVSAQSTAYSATAQNLRTEAAKLRKVVGLVAVQPDVPPGAPTPQRIADVANKFNIRTAGRDRFMQRQAMLSVLGDLAEAPLAQVKDYNGAVSYYGNDGLGRLMADIEFDNRAGFVQGLGSHVNGLGQTSLLPAYAQAQRAIDQGQAIARQTYATAVLPAAGLGGLAALGLTNEEWCDSARNTWIDVTGDTANAFEQWKKCRLRVCAFWDPESSEGPGTADAPNPKYRPCGNPATVIAPSEDAGRLARGLPPNWSSRASFVREKAGNWLDYGVKMVTGAAKDGGAQAAQAAAQAAQRTVQPPPSNTVPATQLPAIKLDARMLNIRPEAIKQSPAVDQLAKRLQDERDALAKQKAEAEAAAAAAAKAAADAAANKGMSTTTMLAVGGGVLALGAVGFYMFSKRRA